MKNLYQTPATCRPARPLALAAALRCLALLLALLLPWAARAQAPTLTAVSPFIGVPGSVLTLMGTNLTGTTTITFTGAAGVRTVTTGFTVASATSITGISVPAGAQSGPVTVTTGSGTSAVVNTVFFSRAKTVATGDLHTVAVRADGSLWAWGSNQFGQLGQGNMTSGYTSPTQVGMGTNWVSAAAGNNHTVAVRTDGSLWAWGSNQFGQLGQGTFGAGTDRTSPSRVGTGTNWVSATAGANHTLAVQANGSLWAWGRNFYGQLGQGSSGTGTDLSSPVRVGTGSSWVSAAAGSGHVVAVQADGSLWAWGYNFNGQLGQGTSGAGTDRTSPTRMGTATNWVSAAAGSFYTVAVQANGSLWAWGRNDYGQLGLGNAAQQNSPVRVGTSNSWVNAEAGTGHTMGEQSCRAVWAWGYNVSGQVGDGTTNDRFSPVQVITPPALALASFAPTSAAPGSTIAVTGTGLLGLGALTVNGATVPLSNISNNTATGFSFVVPTGATATGITTVTNGCGTASSTGFTVNLPPTPTVTAISPFIGSPGSVLTLTGTNLTGTTSIAFAGSAGVKTVTGGFVVNAAGTSITGVVVPAGAQSGPLTVTTTALGTGAASPALFSRAKTLATGDNHTVAVRTDGTL